MLKITPYGIFVGLAIFLILSIIGKFDYKLIGIIIISFFIQSLMCKTCSNKYTLASVLSILPLLIIIFIPDCYKLKNIFVALSIGMFIGRIGCLFAGCCSGKITMNENTFIKYENTFINEKLNKKIVTVQPNIFLELILQYLIIFIVYKSKYGITLFGILNLILIYLTNFWRMERRMGKNSNIVLYSLFLFSILSFFKCNDLPNNYSLSFNPNIYYVVTGVFVTLITSNDINVSSLIKSLK